jgi:sugar phosphate isomerase/epimerase
LFFWIAGETHRVCVARLFAFVAIAALKPSLALSTCWNSFRHHDGYAMLHEIADLGFTHAELSHGIRIVLVPGILKAVEEGVIKISSTHNFCPLPAGVTQAAPNLFEPSEEEPREHEQWLRYTKRSLDFAAQVQARALVVHLGSVKFWFLPPGRKIRAYLSKHPGTVASTDERYHVVLRKACAKLRGRMGPFWEQVHTSLGEVSAYAQERGVALGCENREKFEELPLDDDFPALFEALGANSTVSPAGYWHDTGHADIKQGLGLIDQRAHLEKNANRLLGFHLHDVSAAGKDHQAIGSGRIDFDMVSSFWKPEHLLTLELSPRVTTEDVVASKVRIDALIARRFGQIGERTGLACGTGAPRTTEKPEERPQAEGPRDRSA